MVRIDCKMLGFAIMLTTEGNTFDGVTFASSCVHTEMHSADHEKKLLLLTAELNT